MEKLKKEEPSLGLIMMEMLLILESMLSYLMIGFMFIVCQKNMENRAYIFNKLVIMTQL